MRNCDTCGGSIKYFYERYAKCEYCGKVFRVDGDKFSEVNIDGLYKEASNMFQRGSEQDTENAIEIFEAIGSYKDSWNKAYECRNKIYKDRADEADRRLEEQRQKELAEIERKKREYAEKQKKKIVAIVGATIIIVMVIIIGYVNISNSKKEEQYNHAITYLNHGEYEEALSIFEDLGDYKDSMNYKLSTQEKITARDEAYKKGQTYYEQGLYGEAISYFQSTYDYLDSNEYIEKAAEALYSKAETLFENKKYQDCKDALALIPEKSNYYSKVASLTIQVDDALVDIQNSQTYEQAIAYYINGDFENAQKLFIIISQYLDARDYLNRIGQDFYNEASSFYQQADYPACCDRVILIDTAEEWANYTLALDLFDKASNAYCEKVKEEAKSICRSDGEVAMRRYVDGMVCSALNSNVAANLKVECVIKSVWLHDLTPMDGGYNPFWETNIGLYSRTPYLDNMGNSPKFKLDALEDRQYITYSIYAVDKQYKTISGTISIAQGCSVTPWLQIYGDGVELFTSPKLTKTTRPYSFEVDISDVSDLKVEIHCGTSAGSDPYILTDGFKLSE